MGILGEKRWGYGDWGPLPPPSPYVESALKINTEFCYIQINFFKIKSFEVTKIVKFAVIASLGQKGHFLKLKIHFRVIKK